MNGLSEGMVYGMLSLLLSMSMRSTLPRSADLLITKIEQPIDIHLESKTILFSFSN